LWCHATLGFLPAEGHHTLGEKGEMRMPVIQCDIREGRTEEQKQALAKEITRVVHETIGAPVEYIYVLIREMPGAHHVKAGEALADYVPEGG
jgi:4-oxalocrotonate tautomerase family enzyme